MKNKPKFKRKKNQDKTWIQIYPVFKLNNQ